jgi:uncharacterized protein with ParB-like and HNH nuclease domain
MAVESHDKKLDDLLKMVEEGKAQLPDFQRSWVWDDTKICKLIESITSGFPMGAAMFLANGGEHIRFAHLKVWILYQKLHLSGLCSMDNSDSQPYIRS